MVYFTANMTRSPRYRTRAILGAVFLTLILAGQAGAESWVQEAKLTTTGGNEFGEAVSIDGHRVLVGSNRENHGGISNAGAAHVFEYKNNVWTEVARLVAGDPRSLSEFGTSVSLDGDRALVGADETFVGPPGGAGAAYLFERSGNTWSQTAKLTASDGAHDDRFGYAVSLNGDRALVGAWLHHTSPMSIGAAYVFERAGNTWNQVAELIPADAAAGGGLHLGGSVSLSGDLALVGAAGDPPDGAGAAYIFERVAGVWKQVDKLTAYDRQAEDAFGLSVCLDGRRAMVGSWWDSHDGLSHAGSAYVFERNPYGSWSHVFHMKANDAKAGDEFGWPMSLNGDRVLIGTWVHPATGQPETGSVYMFQRQSPGLDWLEVAKLTPNDATAFDAGPFSVSMGADRAVLGARDKNAAYVFAPSPETTQTQNLNLGNALCPGATNPVSRNTDSAGNVVELDCNGGFTLYYIGTGPDGVPGTGDETRCPIGHCSYVMGENAGRVRTDAAGRFREVIFWNFEGHYGHDPAQPVYDLPDPGYENRDTYIYYPATDTLETRHELRSLTQGPPGASGYSDPGKPWIGNPNLTPSTTVETGHCRTAAQPMIAPGVLNNAAHIASVQFTGSTRGRGQVTLTINQVTTTVFTQRGGTIPGLTRQLTRAFNRQWGQAPFTQQGKVASQDPNFSQIMRITGAVEEEIEIQIAGEPNLKWSYHPVPHEESARSSVNSVVSTDIGGPLPAGVTTVLPQGGFQIAAGGADIWGTTDQFNYAYQGVPGSPAPVSGDFTAIVAVHPLDPSGPGDDWAKAGIMARQDLDPASPNCMVLRSLRMGAFLQGRDTRGAASWNSPVGAAYGPNDKVWLRLDRVGDTFTGCYAVGGTAPPSLWKAAVSHTAHLPPALLLGLATTSHVQGARIFVTYTDFSTGSYAGPPAIGP